MAAGWFEARPGESEAYCNNRISSLKVLSVYIISLGIEAYIPKIFSCRSYLYIPAREDVKLLLSKMDKSTFHNKIQKRLNKDCKVLFLLYFCCGLRLSEGRLLKYEHVDIEKGILTITGSKGNRDQLVYHPDDGIGILGSYMG